MNLNQPIYSKEAVKARMLQNATKLWGVRNAQSLDPIVKLLIDAFSTEVFKANNEIQNVNDRILEKLARLLTPSKYTHPSPAHAIAFTAPIEPIEKLFSHTEFFIKKQLNAIRKDQSDKQLEIAFTPIDHVELVNMQTVLMIAGDTVFGYDEQLNKYPLNKIQSEIDNFRKIHLGIDITNYHAEIFPETLSFYISNTTNEHLDFIYRLLPHVKVTFQDSALEVSLGKTYQSNDFKKGYEQIFNDQSIHNIITDDIKNIYKDRFLEITGFEPNILKENQQDPKEFDRSNPLYENYKNRKILWLTLEFPPQYTATILEEFYFVLNAFPIYNRAWKKTEYNLDIMGNNIPLETEEIETFLYVDEVMDEFGKIYNEIPFTPSDDLERGLYTVRSGGMERFNNRDATDLLLNVMELLRDEVAAFSIFNRDKVKDVLEEISIKMKGLVKKIEVTNKDLRDNTNYIIIEPLEGEAHTYATFWVTHCAMANNFRPGTELNSQKKQQHITLLLESNGGKEEQKRSDSILAFKYALTTRDKIVSAEDVKSFCKMMLKDQLKKITVKRGTMISDRPKEGFIRTVDIEIVANDFTFYGENYWANMADIIKNSIKSKAIDGVEYRIKIVE